MGKTTKWTVGAIASAVAIIVGAILVGQGETHVGLGHVGMVKHPDGTVTEVGQGWHWTGIQNSVEKYPTYTQGSKYNMIVGTADSQKMPVTLDINWKLNTKDAVTLYESVGGQPLDYVQKNIVDQKVQGIVNQVTHQYNWDALLGKNMPNATKQIQKQLSVALAENGIVLESVYFGEVSAPAGMASAQQQTAQAELGKEKAEAQQEQVKIENQTKYLQAKNDLAIKKLEAQANQKVAASLTPELIQQEWIQAWQATGGKVPATIAGNNTGSMFTLPTGK